MSFKARSVSHRKCAKALLEDPGTQQRRATLALARSKWSAAFMHATTAKHWRRWPSSLAAAVLLALATRCLRPDEMHCENAVERLVDCCPGFTARQISCEYVEGCSVRYPAISEDDAHCIAGASCAALVADGVCAAAATAQPRSQSSGESRLCH